MNIQTLCWLVAVVLLTVSAFVNPPRVSLLSIGLAVFALGFLIPAIS